MDFEDDPDYEDEDDDALYDYTDQEDDYPERETAEASEQTDDEGQEAESSEGDNSEESEAETEEEGNSDDSGKVRNIDEKKEEAQRIAEELKKQLGEQKESSYAQISKQNEKIKYLEEENSDLKEKVTKTKGILTGSVVPEEEEDEEDPEDEPIYEERASPDI